MISPPSNLAMANSRDFCILLLILWQIKRLRSIERPKSWTCLLTNSSDIFTNFFHEFFSVWTVEKENKLLKKENKLLIGSMSLVSHKKSYLVCVQLTNFRIFMQPIPIFFLKYKTETANRARGHIQLLENK